MRHRLCNTYEHLLPAYDGSMCAQVEFVFPYIVEFTKDTEYRSDCFYWILDYSTTCRGLYLVSMGERLDLLQAKYLTKRLNDIVEERCNLWETALLEGTYKRYEAKVALLQGNFLGRPSLSWD